MPSTGMGDPSPYRVLLGKSSSFWNAASKAARTDGSSVLRWKKVAWLNQAASPERGCFATARRTWRVRRRPPSLHSTSLRVAAARRSGCAVEEGVVVEPGRRAGARVLRHGAADLARAQAAAVLPLHLDAVGR